MPFIEEVKTPTKCRRCGVYTQGQGYCSKCQALYDEFDGVREYYELIDYTRWLADDIERRSKK